MLFQTKSGPRKISILVVAANVLNQFVIKKIPSGWKDITFVVADHSEEALEQLNHSNHFDIILMDFRMAMKPPNVSVRALLIRL